MRNYKVAVITVFFIVMVFIPQVFALNVTCSPKVNVHEKVRCTVNGIGTAKIYLVAVDGIEIGHSRVWFFSETDDFIRESPSGVSLPIGIEFIPWSLLYRAVKNAFWTDSEYQWALYNRVNYFTFRFEFDNGTVEDVTIPIYIEGDAISEIKEILKAAIAFVSIISILVSIAYIWGRRKGEVPKNQDTSLPSRLSFIFLPFMLVEFYPAMAALFIYFSGSLSTLKGDANILWSIFVLLLWNFEVLSYRSAMLKARKKPITGIEWIPASIIRWSGLSFAVGLIGTVVLFAVSGKKSLNELFRRIAFPASLIWLIILTYTLSPNTILLLMLLVFSVWHVLLISGIESVIRAEEDVVLIENKHQRSPEVEELIQKFDRIIWEMKKDGFYERLSGGERNEIT
ncbi:hypothetical protein [Thermococcus barophilus]|uniref:Uncharacterized protein n=1 Tax=Thermococcus barophilus (strain DSM 11836 / MP) TaxID=391623 RepID=F0LJT1_THEBM|nr:hypothetical protein [Thermococcus barophilus]ADT84723.1 hypothetical protein TERMP_01748 [Thermococcus barophilus MP]